MVVHVTKALAENTIPAASRVTWIHFAGDAHKCVSDKETVWQYLQLFIGS